MPSFSNEVKTEVLKSITDKDKRYACLYGMLLCCKSIPDGRISFNTESEELPQLFRRLIKSVFSSEIAVTVESFKKKNGTPMFQVSIHSNEHTAMILDKYKINTSDPRLELYNIANNSLSTFLAGAFLISGSVSDPYKEYHLEFSLCSQGLAEDIRALLLEMDVHGRIIDRKGMKILYIKNSENIEDTLTFIGASQSTIALMKVKIYKDMCNKANRMANCDTANIDKAVAAAARQIEDINTIKKLGGFHKLSPELKEVCELRLENTEMTLKEIGELLSKPIGRSGVARRFSKIAETAKQLREQNNG